MSGAHVRRGDAGRTKPRKPAPKVAVPKRIAKKLPVDQARANRLAGLAFSGFLLAIVAVVLVALDIPAKAERSAGTAVGRAGFVVSGYQIAGINHMDRKIVDSVVNEELGRAALDAGAAKAPQPLVDLEAIRSRLMQFGWVKDARVSRRLPDTLVIDIVERTPAALWQNKGQLALIDRPPAAHAGRADRRHSDAGGLSQADGRACRTDADRRARHRLVEGQRADRHSRRRWTADGARHRPAREPRSHPRLHHRHGRQRICGSRSGRAR
jgi:hypothetical protein